MAKKRLMIIADTDNWCFANRGQAIVEHAPDDWHATVFVATSRGHLTDLPYNGFDCVFCLPTQYVAAIRHILQISKTAVPLVGSHNSGVGRRWDWFLQSVLSADYTVVNNYGAWLHGRLHCQPQKYAACNISNGVDTDVFFDYQQTRPDRSVVWVSSENKVPHEHPGECNVETDVKGYWAVLRPLKMLLDNTGWKVEYVIAGRGTAFTPEEMAKIYNRNRFVVCASFAEGTPNFVLEAAACGCVPVTTMVGNSPEYLEHGRNGWFVHGHRMRPFFQTLERAIESSDKIRKVISADMKKWSWERRVPFFYGVFDSLVAGKIPAPFSYMMARENDPI